MDPWSYEEALGWLYARQAKGIKLGLEKVHDLLEALGDPHHYFRCVHVAGTNGKGSVTRLLAQALHLSGHRVGMFTSPHLIRFTERIQVDGAMIPQEDVAAGLAAIRPAVERLDAQGTPPTFFEINTALAFWHFERAGVEWAVVETGMGGRLDATNVVRPALTIITNVEMDHMAFLGDSLADITYEKAGIMKRGVPCVTGATGQALDALKAVSRDRRVPMSVLGEDYHVVPDINGVRIVRPGGESRFELALAGAHQMDNAALVVAAVEALRQMEVRIPESAVQRAMATTQAPGRLEPLTLPAQTPEQPNVDVLLDGAHNPAGARALRYHLGRIDWHGFALVVGFSADKDWRAMLGEWLPLAAAVYAPPLRSPRGLPPEAMRDEVEGRGLRFTVCDDVADAFTRARADGAQRILVAGSLFLVGEARAVLLGEPLEEIRGSQ